MQSGPKSPGRREFIGKAAAIGAVGAIGAGRILTSCRSSTQKYVPPVFPERAPDGPLLKAGLIGCGGRGTGAAFNFIDAGPNLQVTALADVFQDRIDRCRASLKERRNVDIPDKNCFVGFDAYKKVIDSDVDIILEASASHFRPLHFEAAVQARKHVFLEKPAGIDPVGVRSVMASGRMAGAAGLSVVAGTQRRHQLDYVTTFGMIKNGAIGNLISANSYYNIGGTPPFIRQPQWCDMEAMLRNRSNWTWLTGDSVVNLLVHNIDAVLWFFEKHPVRASGMGAQLRRSSGDMHDICSVDFIFNDHKTYQTMTRQIDGCTNYRDDIIYGTKGYTNCRNTIWDNDGNIIWQYEYPMGEDGRPMDRVAISPYDQEIINLVTAIRTNNPVNETHNLAVSSMAGIMGRITSYTGRDVTWEEIMNSSLSIGPREYKWGPVPEIHPVAAVPGTPPST